MAAGPPYLQEERLYSGPHFSKPTHSYGEPSGECEAVASDPAAEEDLPLEAVMSCPCGREDYDACQDCPYEDCPVHGDGKWAGRGFSEKAD